jgi:glycosyltransferase involved in cell wall biosynthesis
MLVWHRMKGTWRDSVDLYIALTEFSRQKFISGGLGEAKIAVKPNFVDPDPGPGSGDGDYALFVGRLTDEKGVLTLLESWNHLYPKTPVSLKIIGDGPLRDQVLVAAKHLAGIQYIGRCPSERVYAMMGSARMLVFPSQWFEGQPRTIIESLAKGTPVVASRLGSMPEMIRHGQTGLLFEPGDAADLARQVQEIVTDEPARRRMRSDARAQFVSKYTAESNYAALMQCYQRARQGPS